MTTNMKTKQFHDIKYSDTWYVSLPTHILTETHKHHAILKGIKTGVILGRKCTIKNQTIK